MLNNSQAWKTAKVTVLRKKNKVSSDPKNLRTTSLLPNVSKIFDVCVNIYISPLCKKLLLITIWIQTQTLNSMQYPYPLQIFAGTGISPFAQVHA